MLYNYIITGLSIIGYLLYTSPFFLVDIFLKQKTAIRIFQIEIWGLEKQQKSSFAPYNLYLIQYFMETRNAAFTQQIIPQNVLFFYTEKYFFTNMPIKLWLNAFPKRNTFSISFSNNILEKKNRYWWSLK